ncbi:MAG: hypothetical protein HRU20_25250 [Pseudomonadales bacterium]|nr:hypothetical protein [Pseudomonadales bacterium]
MAKEHGIHSSKGDSPNNDTYFPISVDGFKWCFQKFKVTVKNKNRQTLRTDQSPKLGSYLTQGQIRDNLTDLPKGKNLKRSLNLFDESGSAPTLNNTYKTEAHDESYLGDDVIDLASIGNLLIETMHTTGLLPGDDDMKQLILDAMPNPD